MRKFTQKINENKNSINLIIVDVQNEFKKFIPQGFVDSLIKYCENFDNVYQIWDTNKAQKPTYKFPNEVKVINKKYGTKFSENLKETIEELNQKYPNAVEGDMYEFDDANSYVVKVNNNHQWFYIPEDMSKLFNELKNKKCVLVGGADRECLQDVYVAMVSFGCKVKYDKRFVYSANNSHTQKFDPKTQPSLL